MALPEPLQELVLERIAGGEVDVPALGGRGPPGPAVPDEQGLAQPRARRDQGAIAGPGRAGMQRLDFLPVQQRQAPGRGLEVVDEQHGDPAEFGAERVAADPPGQVGGVDVLLHDGPGDAEDGAARARGCAGQELVHQGFEGGEVTAPQPALEDGCAHGGGGLVKGEVGLGPTDVTGEDHARILVSAASAGKTG